jgi:hypothetical protein
MLGFAAMTTSPPSDLDAVRYAFRLGWAVAELRGRLRPDRYDERDPIQIRVFKRNGYELPLVTERSPAEIRREVVETVEALRVAVQLSDDDSKAPWETLKTTLKEYEAKDADHEGLWGNLAHRFYELDANIQDSLVLQAPQAAAYQLGRGLAETYWALQPACAADLMGSWEFVLGPDRCETLSRLTARLSTHLKPEILAAIKGPLLNWSKVACGEEYCGLRENPEVPEDLFRQGLLWRGLVRGEVSTANLELVDHKLGVNKKAQGVNQAWKNLRLYRTAIATLRVPLAAGVLGIALLAGGGAALASGSISPALSTLAGILGVLGITSAGLYARAKAEVTSLFSNLTQTVEVERVQQAAELSPITSPMTSKAKVFRQQ